DLWAPRWGTDADRQRRPPRAEGPPWLQDWLAGAQRHIDRGQTLHNAARRGASALEISQVGRSRRWFIVDEAELSITACYLTDSDGWWRWPFTLKKGRLSLGRASRWPDAERKVFERPLAAWASVVDLNIPFAYGPRLRELKS